jgi:hypothetical protein
MSADDTVAAREVIPGEAERPDVGDDATVRETGPGEAAGPEAAGEVGPGEATDPDVHVHDMGPGEPTGSDVGDGADDRGVDAGGAAGQGDGRAVDAGGAAGPDLDDRGDSRETDTAEMVFGRPPTRPGDRRSGGAEVPVHRAAVADTAPLIGPDQLEALQRRWGTAQAGFVDDPRRAVEVADEIVATSLAALQSAVEDRLTELSAWRDDANATTDVLLAAFRGYRAVFERVMSA